MKKTVIILALTAITLFSFKLAIDKTNATVNTEQGVSVFIMSKPTQAHDYLGTVKVKLTLSGSPTELFNQAIKKLKKEYPQADGIVFSNIELDKADAIKFKD